MRKVAVMMLLSVGFVWAYVDRSEIRPQLPNDNVSVMSDGSSYTEGLYYMGDTVGLSEYDYPRNAHFKFIQVYENTGSIHITYMRTQTGVQDTRTMFYNFYDPTASSWIDNVGVDAMDATNFGKNGFGDIFLTGDGRAIISAHLNTTSPLISKYGIEDSYLSASFTHYDSPSGPATGSCYYPSVLQTSEGFIFICTDGDGTDPDTNYVFYSSDGTTWNQVFAISQVFPERFDLDYNPAINTAVIAYFEEGGTNESSAIKYRISTDGGATWSDPVVVAEGALYDTVFDAALPVDTFNFSETNPFCDPYLRISAAVTGDGVVHLAWENYCYDGTYVVDTVVDTTVNPPDTTYEPVFAPYPVIRYYNSSTGEIETVIEYPHAGDAELAYDAASVNKPQFYLPRLVRRGGYNDVFLFFLNQNGNQDPITEIYKPDLYVAYKSGTTWDTTNVTNTPDECELWMDVATIPYNNTAYVMYYGDPNECGTSLFGEGSAALGAWYVFPFDLTTAFDEKPVVSGFNYNPVTKTIVFNTAYAGDVNIYAVDGRLISTKKAVNGIVRLADLTTGVYVVKAGQYTGKVFVK